MAILKKKGVVITYCAIILLMLCGSFYDLQLSQSVYNLDSSIGKIFAAFGEYPGMLCAWIGVALFFASREETNTKKPLFIMLGVLLVCFGIVSNTVISFMELYQFLPEFLVPGMIIEMFVSVAAFWLTLKKADGDKRAIRKISIILCLLPLAEVILVNVIKLPWGRPRFRTIAITEGLSFRPWWIIGTDLRNRFVTLGIKAGEFTSFPSGHTANAACALMIVLLSKAFRRLKDKSSMLLIIGLVFTALVAFFRIVVGAHFLTDVTAGFFITYTLLAASVSVLRLNSSI